MQHLVEPGCACLQSMSGEMRVPEVLRILDASEWRLDLLHFQTKVHMTRIGEN